MSELSALRLTPQIMDQTVLAGLQGDQQAITTLSEQMATGNLINKPSDNPAGIVQVLSLQASLARSKQFQANAATGLNLLQLSTSTLNTALDQMQKIRTLILSAGNSVNDAGGLPAITSQVADLEQSLVSLANTSYGGRPIFGGASAAPTIYTVVPPSGGTGGSVTYAGSGEAPTVAVAPGVTVPAGVAGVFGDGTAGSVSVFGAINQVLADLQTGNVAAVTTSGLHAFDQAFQQVTDAAGQAGAAYQQLETMSQQAATTTQEIQTSYANVQSADLAEVSSALAQQQTDYESALYAAAKVTQLPTLQAFLA
jgi:flagellar hook-associated protein 3 FlgL